MLFIECLTLDTKVVSMLDFKFEESYLCVSPCGVWRPGECIALEKEEESIEGNRNETDETKLWSMLLPWLTIKITDLFVIAMWLLWLSTV